MEGSDTVELYIFGLRTVVPKPVTAQANLEWTWYHFLNNICRIKVEPKDAVMACTTSYSAVTKRGWSADLSEKIRVFVDKFALKRDRYSVRLMMQITPNSNPDQSQSSDVTVTVDENDLFNSHSSNTSTPTRRTRSSISCNVTEAISMSSSHNSEIESDSPMDSGMNEHLEAEIDQYYERPYDDPFESPSAPARVCHSRKRKSAAKVEHGDLKSLIKSRVRKLGNPFLGRVQKEIKKLQKNQIWYRNVQYAPLASYLLQEIFDLK